MSKYPEIIIGLVAPIGSNRENIKKYLEKKFSDYGYQVYSPIKITEIIFKKNALSKLPKSYGYYLKMELCKKIRECYGKAYLAALAVKKIVKLRGASAPSKGSVFIIDQIKNSGEYDLLSNIYGKNYIQISCSSNKLKRNAILEGSFDSDIDQMKFTILDKDIFHIKKLNTLTSKGFGSFYKDYKQKILPDSSHNLLAKDFNEADTRDEDDKKHGQQIADIFHQSHYFINLDTSDYKLKEQVNKFVDLLFGKHDEYPTQDEFGMALANSAAVRSNFPGKRQVGACIISEFGEVISAGSIRAPSPFSNPNKAAEAAITDGYTKFKKEIDEWIENLTGSKKHEKFEKIVKYLKSSLEFHPCSHAEIAAICDAAKLGVSTRKATLYTTVFPCHICAKDIISSGIKRVVFCEAYPKSRNEELYSEVLEIDPETYTPEKVPFDTFWGVGPKRYDYVFHIKAKATKSTNGEFVPPFLKYRTHTHYEQIEKDVANFVTFPNNRKLNSHPFVTGPESLLKKK